MNLAQKKCAPCSGDVPPLQREEVEKYLHEIGNWTLVDDHKLHKSIEFKNFKDSLALANKIGEIAEDEGHHPDLLVRWGELVITIWTHKVDGLTEADFILAAKIDELLKKN